MRYGVAMEVTKKTGHKLRIKHSFHVFRFYTERLFFFVVMRLLLPFWSTSLEALFVTGGLPTFVGVDTLAAPEALGTPEAVLAALDVFLVRGVFPLPTSLGDLLERAASSSI